MFKHRIAFVGAWLLIGIGLLAYPGFEARGVFAGMVMGVWPFLLLGPVHKAITLMGALLLSGVTVWLCGWSADAARLSKQTWIVLLVAVAAGATVSYGVNDYSFEDWKNSPAISAAMEAGELKYEPTLREYHESVTIPGILMGAMWGLYLIAAASFVCSIVVGSLKLPHRRRHAVAAGASDAGPGI